MVGMIDNLTLNPNYYMTPTQMSFIDASPPSAYQPSVAAYNPPDIVSSFADLGAIAAGVSSTIGTFVPAVRPFAIAPAALTDINALPAMGRFATDVTNQSVANPGEQALYNPGFQALGQMPSYTQAPAAFGWQPSWGF